ncbi:ParA family protein [Dermacoccus nishinomiyaensis]
MHRIVVTNTKGGVGKTTTALYLACALATRGKNVEVWDADPQGSATEWALRAQDAAEDLPCPVASMNAVQLRRTTPSADFTLIDTAPGDWKGIDTALEQADVAILPCAPSGLDLDRLWETERVASQKCPSYVLLTQVDRRTRSFDAALAALEGQGVGYFETTIPSREAIRQSYGHRPAPSALHGYEHVITELLEAMSW